MLYNEPVFIPGHCTMAGETTDVAKGNLIEMMRPSVILATLAAVALIGCGEEVGNGAGSLMYVFSFEPDMQGWAGKGTDLGDPPIAWSVDLSTEQAADSTTSVKFYLENYNDKGKIWMERMFRVEPGGQYRAKVRYQFASRDWGVANLWTIITGVRSEPADSTDDLAFQGDTGNGRDSDAGYVWMEKDYTFDAVASPTGRLYIQIGIWGTWETPRAYYVDFVYVTLTPK